MAKKPTTNSSGIDSKELKKLTNEIIKQNPGIKNKEAKEQATRQLEVQHFKKNYNISDRDYNNPLIRRQLQREDVRKSLVTNRADTLSRLRKNSFLTNVDTTATTSTSITKRVAANLYKFGEDKVYGVLGEFGDALKQSRRTSTAAEAKAIRKDYYLRSASNFIEKTFGVPGAAIAQRIRQNISTIKADDPKSSFQAIKQNFTSITATLEQYDKMIERVDRKAERSHLRIEKLIRVNNLKKDSNDSPDRLNSASDLTEISTNVTALTNQYGDLAAKVAALEGIVSNKVATLEGNNQSTVPLVSKVETKKEKEDDGSLLPNLILLLPKLLPGILAGLGLLGAGAAAAGGAYLGLKTIRDANKKRDESLGITEDTPQEEIEQKRRAFHSKRKNSAYDDIRKETEELKKQYSGDAPEPKAKSNNTIEEIRKNIQTKGLAKGSMFPSVSGLWDRMFGKSKKKDDLQSTLKQLRERSANINDPVGDRIHQDRVEQQKSQFMQFGKLPQGFEFLPGHMGRLGQANAWAAAGAMPLGNGVGGGNDYSGGMYPGGLGRAGGMPYRSGESGEGTRGTTYGYGTGAPGEFGKSNVVDPNQMRDYVIEKIKNSRLNGYVPADGERYGIKKGTPEEWANYLTGLAKHESNLTNSTHGDKDRFGGHGSRGLFQLSPADATTYKLNDGKPFSYEQLADPKVNTDTAIAIHEQLVLKRGSIRGGAGQYWGPIEKEGWTPGRGRDAKLPWEEWKNGKSTRPDTPQSTNFPKLQGAIPGLQAPPNLSALPKGADIPVVGDKANWNRMGGDVDSIPKDLVKIQTPFGGASVHKSAAAAYQGFFADLHEAGMPIDRLGSYNKRKQSTQFTDGTKWSQHAYGNAIDINDSVGWSPKIKQWLAANPDKWESIKKKWGMKQGIAGDPNHVEFGGTIAPQAMEQLSAAAAKPTPTPQLSMEEKYQQETGKSATMRAITGPAQTNEYKKWVEQKKGETDAIGTEYGRPVATDDMRPESKPTPAPVPVSNEMESLAEANPKDPVNMINAATPNLDYNQRTGANKPATNNAPNTTDSPTTGGGSAHQAESRPPQPGTGGFGSHMRCFLAIAAVVLTINMFTKMLYINNLDETSMEKTKYEQISYMVQPINRNTS